MQPIYSVIIRSDIPDRELEFLNLFCHSITSPTGGPDLREFRCTKVDVLHHNYIEIETIVPSDQSLTVLRIPHHLVFLIVGSETRPAIGYAQPSTQNQ